MDKCIYCGLDNYRPTSKWCSRNCEKKHRRQIFKEENRCVKCGNVKEDSLKSVCDTCISKSNRYYLKNKTSINEKSKIRYDEAKDNNVCTVCGKGKPYKNKLKCKKCDKAAQEQLQKYKNNPDFLRASLLARAKQRAKEFNLQFDITIDDIIVPEKCPILGIDIKCGNGKSTNSSPSLDRIVPELGYVKGNVCVISQEANRLKSDLTKEMIFKILKYIKNCGK